MKKVIVYLLCLVMTFSALTVVGSALDISQDVSIWDGTAEEAFNEGTGTEIDPYIISTAGQLNYLVNQCMIHSKTYTGEFLKLAADIDWGVNSWTPIGDSVSTSFSGTFDGAGHTIYNLKCTYTYAGVFGCLLNATVKNLAVDYATFSTTTRYAGAIAAYAKGSNIQNCTVMENVIVKTSDLITSTPQIGGVVGLVAASSVVDTCVNKGEVLVTTSSGVGFAGGVAGIVGDGGLLKNSINMGKVVTENAVGAVYTGGVVGGLGSSSKPGTLQNSINTGDVSNKYSYCGGIVGRIHVAASEMTNSYNFGTVTANTDMAGLFIGHVNGDVILSTNYSVSFLEVSKCGAVVEGKNPDLAEMTILTDSEIFSLDGYTAIITKTNTDIPAFNTVYPSEYVETTVPETTVSDTTVNDDTTIVETTVKTTGTTSSPTSTTSSTAGADDTSKTTETKTGCGKSSMMIAFVQLIVVAVGTTVFIKKK